MYTLYFTVSALFVFTEVFHVTVAVVATLLLTIAENAPKLLGGGTILFIESFFLHEKNSNAKKTTSRLKFNFNMIFFDKCKIFLLSKMYGNIKC
jgi:hypothetical protein